METEYSPYNWKLKMDKTNKILHVLVHTGLNLGNLTAKDI